MAQDDIQGQVVDPSGNPVSGAIVELTRSFESNPVEEQTVLRTTTDSNGNYIFESHPDGDGTTQDYHVSCYNHDGSAYVNSFNNPGVTADLSAILDSAIDSFEDQNIAEYTQYSSGTVSNVWSFAQSPTPQDGSFILESNGSGLDPQIIRSTSGLPYYPESGDKYHYYTYIGGNDKTGTEFEFATQSDTANPDTYLIRIDPLGDLAAIRERVGGATTGLANTTFSDPAGQWYEVVLDWTAPGAATVGCYDLNGNQQWELSFSDSDTTNNLASGGIGWANDPFNGVSVYWDDLRQVADDYTP